jgi:hypothetical protein
MESMGKKSRPRRSFTPEFKRETLDRIGLARAAEAARNRLSLSTPAWRSQPTPRKTHPVTTNTAARTRKCQTN